MKSRSIRAAILWWSTHSRLLLPKTISSWTRMCRFYFKFLYFSFYFQFNSTLGMSSLGVKHAADDTATSSSDCKRFKSADNQARLFLKMAMMTEQEDEEEVWFVFFLDRNYVFKFSPVTITELLGMHENVMCHPKWPYCCCFMYWRRQ